MQHRAALLLALACGLAGRTAPLSQQQAPPGGGRAGAPYAPYASYPAASYPMPTYALPVAPVQPGQGTAGSAAAPAATPGRPKETAAAPRHSDRQSDSGTESSWRENADVYANLSLDEVHDGLRRSSSPARSDSG